MAADTVVARATTLAPPPAHLVYLNPSGELGGAERILLSVFSGLREARPEWRLHLVVSDPGPLAEEAAALGVEVSVLPFPPRLRRLGEYTRRTSGSHLPDLPGAGQLTAFLASAPGGVAYALRLRRLLRRVRPALVHTNGIKMHLLGAWAAPPGSPLVWHVHDYIGERPLSSRLLRGSARRCSMAVAISASVADDLARLCPRLRVRAVTNGIDLTGFSPLGPGADLDALSGLPPAPPGTVRIGLPATFARWKGHAVFLEALARLPPDLSVRGYVVGGSLYRTEGSQHTLHELQSLAARLGLVERVGFAGFQAEPARALRALDIVVHCSTEREPFGLTIAEAMACGRAVISSAAGGAAEFVTPGVDALTHRPGSAHELAQAMTTLCRDPEIRRRLGHAARATAERRLDRRRLVRELIAAYAELRPPP